MRIGMYPGSFDPVTNGHIDIINRARKLFDKLYVCIAINPNKKSFFTIEEKITMLKEVVKNMDNVEICFTSGLVIQKAKELNVNCLVRGLRAVTDFEFEFQLKSANEYIDPSIEMVFLMSSIGKEFISSSNIKDFYFANVDISNLVPDVVIEFLDKKKK